MLQILYQVRNKLRLTHFKTNDRRIEQILDGACDDNKLIFPNQFKKLLYLASILLFFYHYIFLIFYGYLMHQNWIYGGTLMSVHFDHQHKLLSINKHGYVYFQTHGPKRNVIQLINNCQNCTHMTEYGNWVQGSR